MEGCFTTPVESSGSREISCRRKSESCSSCSICSNKLDFTLSGLSLKNELNYISNLDYRTYLRDHMVRIMCEIDEINWFVRSMELMVLRLDLREREWL